MAIAVLYVVRDMILDEKVRFDGCGLKDIRALIWKRLLPSPHGAAIFTRGETQL
jgi:polyribonucleotide nucleotidyltransferase